jgi:exopolysaccharide biosynthesis polyprenyl glycosylphosphotransferase
MVKTLADVPTSTQSERERPRARAAPRWVRRYLATTLAADAVSVLLATTFAELLRFGLSDPTINIGAVNLPYFYIAVVLVPAWIAVMAFNGCYDYRVFGAGLDEYRQVMTGGVQFLAALAVFALVLKLDIARGVVFAVIPLSVMMSLVGRWLVRQRLQRSRAKGLNLQRVLIVGSSAPVKQVTRHLDSAPWTGFYIVGAYTTEHGVWHPVGDASSLPVLEDLNDVADALETLDIESLVVANGSAFPQGELQQLSWMLEDAGSNLIVAPGTTEIAGPRVSIRPAADLPLLYVERPRFSVGARAYKVVFDPCIALLGLILFSPLLLATAVAVRCTSRGPVLFRQKRVGLNGELFTLWKFRTMLRNAPEQQATFAHANDADGVLFKLWRDPRVTSVGRVLRRFSIDELPQLVQVLNGKMSLVGPRPPLPDEVARYEGDTHRRLLVKPGITGLWQVNGRSDLAWDEAVRLDLYYVNHWSPAMDCAIILKTIGAVIRGRGAY